MIEMKSEDTFQITGRGQVFTFKNDQLPQEILSPEHLTGQTVMIDGKLYLVRGAEMFRPISAGGHVRYKLGFGLLIKEVHNGEDAG